MIIVTGKGKNIGYSKVQQSIKVINDIYPGKAALGAIYTGLINANNKFGVVVACDMPFLNIDLLNYLIELAPDFDAVIPRIGNLVEPLHGIYSKQCISAIKKMLDSNNLSVTSLFNYIKIRYVSEEEINKIDLEHLSFFNINTEDDLFRANNIAKTIGNK